MRSHKQTLFFLIGIFFTFVSFFPSTALATGVATVISLTEGVSVERNGVTQPLELKASLQVKDVIRTNATGKAQLIFSDNSAVSLGVNSVFSLDDYSDAERKSFKGNLAVGIARFVTGTIVEGNPDAFVIRTPQTHIGVRGTTLSIHSLQGQTSVFTENSMRKDSVVVGDVVIEPGYMAVFGANSAVITPPTRMTDAQRQNLVKQVSSLRAPELTGVTLEGLQHDASFKNDNFGGANLLQPSIQQGSLPGSGDDDDDDDD